MVFVLATWERRQRIAHVVSELRNIRVGKSDCLRPIWRGGLFAANMEV